MLNASVVLYTSFRFYLKAEKSKLRVIGHNPNSTKFQLAIVKWKTFEPIFFTSYNEFCSRQRRTKGSRAGRALDGVPTVANRMI